MRDLWFALHARKRGSELFEQGSLVTSKSRAARASAAEVAQMDQELPADATTRQAVVLGKEARKPRHPYCFAYKAGNRRVEKPRSIIGHNIADVRSEREIHGRQEAGRSDARLCQDKTAGQHKRSERSRHRR